ncbi:MAG: hypothetical protein KC457_30550 [Myxococcales bacterium]|nr:hypothetical protein [Myxococcales bacterium]
MPLIVCLALMACRGAEPQRPDGPAAGSAAEARFELRGPAGPQRLAWSETAGNMVFCRHYDGADRGDYLWIRLAATPEQDGDAGPRLDIDLCRFEEVGEDTEVGAMEAGQHGSHCRSEPGVAIWWHEGELAFNNGAVGDADCKLSLTRGEGRLAGRFSCGPLRRHVEAGEGDDRKDESVTVVGSFTCTPTVTDR